MRKALTFICGIGLLFTAGCFDMEERLVINDDLSGVAKFHFAVEKAYLEQMKIMFDQMAQMMPDAEPMSDPKEMMFNKAEIQQKLAEDNQGVELIAFETSEADGQQIWDMEFSFKDINKIGAVYEALSTEDEEIPLETVDQPATESEEPLMTKQADGTWLFYRSFDEAPGGDEAADEYGEDYGDAWSGDEEEGEDSEEYSGSDDTEGDTIAQQVADGVKEWAQGMNGGADGSKKHYMRFEITFPGDIIESNATSVNGRTAIWEYTMDQIDDAPPEQRAVIK